MAAQYALPVIRIADIDALPRLGDGRMPFVSWHRSWSDRLTLMDMHDVLRVDDADVPAPGDALYDRFQAKDHKLFAVLSQRLVGADATLIAEANGSGRRLWRLLEVHHAEEADHERDLALSSMDRLAWEADDTAKTFSIKFNELLVRLSELDYEEPLHETKRKLMGKLPLQRYAPVWDRLRDIDTLQGVFQRLQIHDVEFDAVLKPRVPVAAVAEAAAAEAQTPGRGSRRRDRSRSTKPDAASTLTCYNCKEEGHGWQRCPALRKKFQAQAGKPSLETSNCVITLSRDAADWALASSVIANEAWVVDTGASVHMCPDRSAFSTYYHLPAGAKRVACADHTQVPVLGQGTVRVSVRDASGELVEIELHDVLHVPNLRLRLLSASAVLAAHPPVEFYLQVAGAKLTCDAHGWDVPLRRERNLVWLDSAGPALVAELHAMPAELGVLPAPPTAAPAPDEPQTAAPAPDAVPVLEPPSSLMHERLGHPSARIQAQATGCLPPATTAPVCEPCVLGKSRMPSVPRTMPPDDTRVRPGSVVAMDLVGPVAAPTFQGARYALVFIDRATRYVVGAYLLVAKSDATECLAQVVIDAPQLTKQVVRLGLGTVLQCDNDSVFRGSQFQAMCTKLGVTMRCSPPYLPSQNGLIERVFATLFPRVRALLIGGHLPEAFWGLALKHAVYLYNVLPHSALEGLSPHQAATGEVPDLSVLRVFGSPAYAVLPPDQRTKLAPTAQQGLWVGFQPVNGCARVFLQATRSVVEVLAPVVDESVAARGGASRTTHAAAGLHAPDETALQCDDDAAAAFLSDMQTANADALSDVAQDVFEFACAVTAGGDHPPDPTTPAQAFDGPNGPEWKASLQHEFKTQGDNTTWTLIPLADVPPGAQVLRPLLAFRTKYNADGSVNKRKVRICVRGCAQRPGDIGETFAPVARLDSVRLGFALAAAFGLEPCHADVVFAFLNADLPEPRYMHVPEGIPDTAPNGARLVCKVTKCLNGYADSPRIFSDMMAKVLTDLRFQRVPSDPCVYVRAGKPPTVLIVWVDDLLVLAPSVAAGSAVFAAIGVTLPLVDGGTARTYLGMSVAVGEGRITLTQCAYVRALLARYPEAAKPIDTPAEPGVFLQQAAPCDPAAELSRYQALVGALLYVSVCTRPDIAFAVHQLTRHMVAPAVQHWDAAVRVLRYLVTTVDLGLVYRATASPQLTAYADASFASVVENRRSVGGALFMLAGAAIAWRSKAQTVTALSSTEAEYVALCDVCQDAVYLQALVAAMTGAPVAAVVIFEDNQPCLAIARDPAMAHRATRHIQVKFHYVRDSLLTGAVQLQYLPTEDMIADALTKALARPRFRALRARMLGFE